MKKLIIPILLLLSQIVQADLPVGDFTLVTAKEIGAKEISFITGKIENENQTKYLSIPHLGRTKILASAEGGDFHAIYLPRMVEYEGKEYEKFSVVVVSISIAESGLIYATISESRSAYAYDRTQYILKQGKLE